MSARTEAAAAVVAFFAGALIGAGVELVEAAIEDRDRRRELAELAELGTWVPVRLVRDETVMAAVRAGLAADVERVKVRRELAELGAELPRAPLGPVHELDVDPIAAELDAYRAGGGPQPGEGA